MEQLLLKLLENSNNKEIIEAVNVQADILHAQAAAIESLGYFCSALLALWACSTIYFTLTNYQSRTRLKKLSI